MKNRDIAKSGFTILELLVVVFIMALLLAISLVAVNKIQRQARVKQAKAEMKQLNNGIRDYFVEYGRPPCSPALIATNSGSDLVFIEDQWVSVIAFMLPQNASHLGTEANPRKRQFVALTDFTIEDGEIVDPWGTPYRIILDTDFDDDPRGGSALMSAGPPSGTWGVRWGDQNDLSVAAGDK